MSLIANIAIWIDEWYIVRCLSKSNGIAEVTDRVENIILEHLRAIRTDVGGIKDDVREIKQRLTYSDVVDQHARYDRLVERVERIERRLDLAEG